MRSLRVISFSVEVSRISCMATTRPRFRSDNPHKQFTFYQINKQAQSMRKAHRKLLISAIYNLVSLLGGTQGTNSISLFQEFERFFTR